jgi:hypothetical protein
MTQWEFEAVLEKNGVAEQIYNNFDNMVIEIGNKTLKLSSNLNRAKDLNAKNFR